MELAVNYSPTLAGLVRAGLVRFDRYKCPAWPGMLAEAVELPRYIHFPLVVGSGLGYPLNEETHGPADLDAIAALMDETGTPLVNTHFIPSHQRHPAIDIDSRSPADARKVIDATLRDLEPLIRRFGPERVTVENIINEYGWLTLAVLPETIHTLLEESGCGFLLDFSHARLAARNLGLDERAYTDSLPVDKIREVHITGLQKIEGEVYDRLMAAGNPGGFATKMAGKWMDHLPMTPADWPEVEWMAQRIRSGAWAMPWIAGYEYGGVGGFWEVITRREVYLEELPRLWEILK